jgi:hypothetical protein
MLKLTSKGLTAESKRTLTECSIVGTTAVGTHEILYHQKEHRRLKTAAAAAGGLAALFVKNNLVSAAGMGVLSGAVFFAFEPKSEILFKRKAA